MNTVDDGPSVLFELLHSELIAYIDAGHADEKVEMNVLKM